MGTENLAHVVEYLPSKCEALVPPEKKTKQTQKKGQMWWHMPTIPVLRRMSKRSLSWTPVWALRDPVSKKKKKHLPGTRQGGSQFEGSPGQIVYKPQFTK
jgi:hypothetical protein